MRVPILTALKKWPDHHLPKTSEQGTIGKAIRYCVGHWPELNHYLLDGRIERDKSMIENSIRQFALGRKKNWLLHGSHSGAKAGATFNSLIETCIENIEPYKYLCAMLNRICGCVTEDNYRKLLPESTLI